MLPDFSIQIQSHAFSETELHVLYFATNAPVPLIYQEGPSLLEQTYLSYSFHSSLLLFCLNVL